MTEFYTMTPNEENRGDGFERVLYFYQRGPNDPPGNQWVWMCRECDQVRARGHAPDCRWSRDEAHQPAHDFGPVPPGEP